MTLKSGGLTAFREGLAGVLDRTCFRAAGYCLELADQLVPVDTSSLQSTGRREPEALNGSAEYKVVFGNKQGVVKFVNYQGYVEADQPYLSIAAREVDISAIAREELQSLAGRTRA